MIELVIPEERFPRHGVVNVNQERGHTRHIARHRVAWRALGRSLTAGLGREQSPVQITVLFRFPDNRVRDSSNLFPTVKALVDGIVDAGGIVADDDRHVLRTVMERDMPNGPRRVTVRIESLAS